MARRRSNDYDSDDESPPPRNRQFAPPSYNFAPPANLNDTSKIPSNESGEDAYAQRLQRTREQDNELDMEDAEYQPPPPPAVVPNEATGDDAYERRPQMSQQPPPPPPPEQVPSKPSMSAFQPPSATISRAPVRYTLPPAPEDIPATEEELEAVFAKEEPVQDEGEEAPRSLRPGQKGFAERLMAKYGWTKGSGLGAAGTGIVNALQVKVEKQKKKPDSEGGGFATPAGRGKIIASKKKNEEEGKFGPMSEVIVLYGMLDGMDLANELDNSQGGGLMQEIGEECNEKVRYLVSVGLSEAVLTLVKYGRVERVFIHRESSDPIPVFVKFTAQLSALRVSASLFFRPQP
ncbi:hypothetical protein EIK77_006977 [Talaromyces pinophilus]|nr:hypothetical protein EIK77_006977 [Talaromyces pinophilus]